MSKIAKGFTIIFFLLLNSSTFAQQLQNTERAKSSSRVPANGNLFFLKNDAASSREINVERLSSIDAAIDELNALVGPFYRTLIIPNEQSLAADLTIPDFVSLKITGGGLINTSSHKLVIKGAFEAPAHKVFAGSGEVEFLGRVAAVYPEWFDARGDGETNDTEALNKAVFASSTTGSPVALVGGRTYGVSSPLDGNASNAFFVSRPGKAILKPLAGNPILDSSVSGKYDGWKFDNVEFRGACGLIGTRQPEFRQCSFRVAAGYAVALTGVSSPRLIDPEFYGTRPGVMASGQQDPAAISSAIYGSALRLLPGTMDVQLIRPKIHFCANGIAADTTTSQPMRGLYIEDAQVRGDWWNSPFVIKRFTPTGYNSSTGVLTLSGGGFTGFFGVNDFHIVSIPIGVTNGTSFSSLAGNTVTVAGGLFASARKGDSLETRDGKRAEILTVTSPASVTIAGWESVDTYEPTTTPAARASWRLTRYYGTAGTFISDTTIQLYGDPVNPFDGERLVADAGLSPVGKNCKTMATMIYTGVHLNGGVSDFQLKGGKFRGSRADQISIFDSEAPKVIGATVDYGFDEGVTITRAPRAIISKNRFEQCGVSAVAAIESPNASITENVVNNWGTVNRNGLGMIDGAGRAMLIRGNIGKVAPGGNGSGAVYLINLNYDSSSDGTIIEGNVDGGARAATVNTHANTGVITTRDHLRVAGAGAKSVTDGTKPGPRPANPLAYWPFEEASGNARDRVGNNHLTRNGGVGSAAGVIGNAASFATASKQFFAIADNTDLPGGAISFSYALWFWLEDGNATYAIISKENESVSGEFLLFYPSGGRLTFRLNGATSVSTPVTFRSWNFVVVYYDHANSKIGISLNGADFTTTTTTGAPADSAVPFCVGARNGFDLFLNGRVDELRFWKGYVLTQSDVKFFYNSGQGRML